MPTFSSTAPVVLAGMHRSGTSLVGSLLAAQGIDMGADLLPADSGNPHGYFEDVELLTLQRRLLAGAVLGGEGGHPDWGWVERGSFDESALARGIDEARAIVARRRAAGGRWGWKDPRTTLLLEWWDTLLGADARYLLVYREPWEVAESMQRSGAAVWVGNPGYAARIWCAYNERLLRFHARHRERVLLVSTRALVASPERFAHLVGERLGISFDPASLVERRDPELLRMLDPADPLPGLWLRTHPAAARVLAELESAAELPSRVAWEPRPSRLAPRPDATLSIVIPCFEMGELLVDAIASVERTATAECELLVVDDGSRDEATKAIVAAVEALGYRVLRQENGGLAAARNRGFADTSGRYLLPLDADNRLLAGFVADAIAALDSDPAIGVVYGDRAEIGLRRQTVALAEMEVGAFLWCNWIDACAVMRRQVWEQAGGYDARAAVWEDWELWVSALESGWRFHHLARPVFEYRVRPESMLATAGRRERLPAAYRHIVREHAPFFCRHLEAVLLAAQRDRQGLLAEAHSQQGAREVLTHELRRRDDELAGRIDRLALVERELAAASAETERLRERLAFVESTRAWRLRRALLALRGRDVRS